MELILAAIGGAAFLVAILVTPAVRRGAWAVGFVDHPGERKIHSRTIAYGGGIALAAVLALVLAAAAWAQARWQFYPTDNDAPEYDTLYVVAAGAFLVLALGIVDDRYRLSAFVKLAAQVAIAAATVTGGVRITAFIGDNWVMKCVTVIWITLITNSFNLLDNMDGLCCGTVSIAAAMLCIVAAGSGQWTDATVMVVLCGACAGFFIYNCAPASIFLGDAGSLLCGYLMATFTVLVTYYRDSEPSHLAIGIPLLVLAIPLYDTLSVIFIRITERRPVMQGDTSHFSHRLANLGMSRPQAVATIHLACLAIGLSATLLGKVSEPLGLLLIAQACMVLTIIAVLERAGYKRRP